jgi:hypothetical protein
LVLAEEFQHDYFKDRFEDNIRYYGHKSALNKRRFKLTQSIVLIASVLIPIINVMGTFISINFIIVITSVLGAIIAISFGFSQIEKYQENWLNYRNTLELLKREKSYFQNDVEDYFGLSEVEKKRLLVERVEMLMSSDTTKYFIMSQSRKAENAKIIDQ